MANLTLDNKYYNITCNALRAEEITIPTLPNAGFLRTDEDGKITGTTFFDPIPTSFMNFSTQWQNLGIPLTADTNQFYGFYTQTEAGPGFARAKFTCNLAQGLYNAYCLAYNDPEFVANTVLVYIKDLINDTAEINTGIFIPPNGYNIIETSPSFTLDYSSTYEIRVEYNTRVGLTQFYVEQPPAVVLR
jgi:hypothetical protein